MKTKSLHIQLVEWRQDLHMNPQVGFEEEFASKKVASLTIHVKSRILIAKLDMLVDNKYTFVGS